MTHKFESKIVGYEEPSEPQWVQEIVRCYQPPIREHTCKNCGTSFKSSNNVLLFFSLLYERCPGPHRNPMDKKRKCAYSGKLTRITTAGCDHCDVEDK